jgi:DNA-binding GntR family transcriptional regulator
LSDDIESKGSSAEQQILECTVVEPTAYIREKLGLQTESVMVQKIKRVRYSGITPIGIHTAYLPLINGNQEISVEELMEMKSLYKTISVKWSMVPFEAIESISCRLPSATECQLLEMPMNESVLTCNRTTYSAKYVPMEYVEMIYPSSRYEYKIRINRKSFQP